MSNADVATEPASPPSCKSILGQLIKVENRNDLPFEFKQSIGHGSSAYIDMVSDKSTKQVFALKIFKRHVGQHLEAFESAITNEVSIMERLSSHPHIIQFHGIYKWGRDVGILLSPAASNYDLGAYFAHIWKNGLTAEQEVILTRALGCLANGLAYIHTRRIRHKDIKPQNILVHHGRIVYTDFGISFDADEQDDTTIGFAGAFTRRYCAPEVNDHTSRNQKSDVFSLGCVFVEIFDVLHPEIGFRDLDELPYSSKIDPVRKKLAEANVSGSERRELFLTCHDMLESDQTVRIDTDSVVSRIIKLGKLKYGPEGHLFCNDCSTPIMDNEGEAQEEPVSEPAVIDFAFVEHVVRTAHAETEDIRRASLLNETPVLNVPLAEPRSESTTAEAAQRRKKKKFVFPDSDEEGSTTIIPPSAFSGGPPRYYCTTCQEHGHTSARCINKCWACGKLYHKSFQCPNKCWTCDQVGHKARNCPNECDACSEVGHSIDDCPHRCWTCGEVGHFARDCQDPCFVCDELGHRTQKCRGKCHKCGKIGHWKKDCGNACFGCGELGHWVAQCPSKSKKARGSDARNNQRAEKTQEWRPIFEQVPQGPYRLKPRRSK